ncbi:hypothetical protein WA1_18905 [Scytonema hofmannii PCC 7110]|uniref:Uncharacterized protein n=1 Tax=Scytonema hofmannii PCC 7110 TaxID=128403 RepID=A0A139XBP7_9CYAN|nr:hypothetical protein [Scytonema hofmannii]KYC42073.1 hypothetical protein WA1_18905 [Scytonema hofmannii PCC 7110]
MPYSDRIESAPGIPGMQGCRRIPGGIATFKNSSNEVAQVSTITVGTAAVNTAYNVLVDGQTVTYQSTATDTATGIRDGLIAEINLASLGVRATATGAGTFTLTGYPGVAFSAVITGGGTGYAIAPTATAAQSSPIGFGLAVVRATTDKEDVARIPTANTQQFLGVTLHSQKAQYYGGGASYDNTEPMPVIQMGSIWVPVEGTMTVNSKVYVRFQASGSNTLLGGFTATAGTGVVELSGARCITGGTGLAEIFLTGSEKFVVA